jgi:hypothetical protein
MRLAGLRLAGLFLLLAFVAGCAPPPAPIGDAPPPYPASTRARMLRIAEGEWREWGGHVLDARRQAVSDAAEGPQAENHPAAFARLLAYWDAVGWSDLIARNRQAFTEGREDRCTPDELAAGGRPVQWGCQPWSAAFIGFVLRATGIDRADFPPDAAHFTYVDALIRRGERWGGRVAFLARDIAEHAPRPGDLVCADRSRTPIASLAQRRAEIDRPRPMHCDIVLSVVPGEVLAVGGNVAQGVTAVRHATDADGRLRRDHRAWFVVFENRMGMATDRIGGNRNVGNRP